MATHGTLASEIIAAALGCAPEPPVDLRRVAGNLGVAEILCTSFRDGFTDFTTPRPVIYLNKVEQVPRMRFVLAHELAHVMLRKPAATDLIERRGRSCLLPGEENIADAIASTLLMPDDLVEMARRVNLTLEKLEQIADCAEVTPVMLITRLATAGIDVGLLHWRRGSRSWHVVDRPGVPGSLHGYIAMSKIGSIVFESLGQHESAIVADCRVGGRNVKIHGTAWRKGWHVVQLIAPSRDIVFPSRPVPPETIVDSWWPITRRTFAISYT